jgi:hypothetical protein
MLIGPHIDLLRKHYGVGTTWIGTMHPHFCYEVCNMIVISMLMINEEKSS